MNRAALPLLFAAVLLLSSAAPAATIDVTLQARVVAGAGHASDMQGEFGHIEESAVAPDNGPFDEARDGSVYMSTGVASGGGWQSSQISDTALQAEGTHFANADLWTNDGYAYSSGRSTFDVRFTLTEDADYTISGFAEEFDGGTTLVRLSGPSGNVEYFPAPSNNTLTFDTQGTLPAGDYQLFAQTSGGATYTEYYGGDYSSGAYEVNLALATITDAPIVSASPAAAFPNPFRESTRLTVPEGASALRIFDARGRLVASLPATESAEWNGTDLSGREVPAGVYYLRANVVGAETARVVRLR
ncbi:MAG TPA: T9SS type A sorting domain-containing protein [bacterium]|nr:T9SS type A sorting domain-containing protein [bacterium]